MQTHCHTNGTFLGIDLWYNSTLISSLAAPTSSMSRAPFQYSAVKSWFAAVLDMKWSRASHLLSHWRLLPKLVASAFWPYFGRLSRYFLQSCLSDDHFSMPRGLQDRRFSLASHSSSACTKGFAISSLPSTGEISTSSVPRATTRPSGREEVFPSSSIGTEVSVWGLRRL